MAQLDELNGPELEQGQDAHVIGQKVPTKVGWGSTLFEVILWVLFIIPGLVFLFKKISAKNYFEQLQQRINKAASTIDIKLQDRDSILQNLSGLVQQAVNLDKETYSQIAAYRGGINPNADMNQVQGNIDNMFAKINIAMERYPELQAHGEIRDAIQQNRVLQAEISAARDLYNDLVDKWNRDIFEWPTKQIVAAKQGYTTRIPFAASTEVRRRAEGKYF